jgi:hypothetical protein
LGKEFDIYGEDGECVGQVLRYMAYIPIILQEQGQELFDHQCVPTESELLAREAFPVFLAKRRKMIAQELNDFLFKS